MKNERVECFWCLQQVWKEETEYFNHDLVEGYTCEPCRQEIKELCAMQRLKFTSMIEQYKANPPKPQKPITFES